LVVRQLLDKAGALQPRASANKRGAYTREWVGHRPC
jgi:hypothetical protein